MWEIVGEVSKKYRTRFRRFPLPKIYHVFSPLEKAVSHPRLPPPRPPLSLLFTSQTSNTLKKQSILVEFIYFIYTM